MKVKQLKAILANISDDVEMIMPSGSDEDDWDRYTRYSQVQTVKKISDKLYSFIADPVSFRDYEVDKLSK
jgi:hypothetical protein